MKIKQKLQRIVGFISIGIFTFTFAHLLSLATTTPNPHCPANLMTVNECPLALSAQIDELQNAFLTIIPSQDALRTLFSLFAAFITIFGAFYAAQFLRCHTFFSKKYSPDIKTFSWISLLFVRGILNPKLFQA